MLVTMAVCVRSFTSITLYRRGPAFQGLSPSPPSAAREQLLDRRRRQADQGRVLLHVRQLGHPAQRGAHARRGAHELERALGVGGEALEHLGEGGREITSELALEDRGRRHHVEAELLRGL